MEKSEIRDFEFSRETEERSVSRTSAERGEVSGELCEAVDRMTGNLLNLYLLMSFDRKAVPLKNFIADIERRAIALALEITDGHQRKASYLLGIKENVLCTKKQKYQLK